MFGPNGDLVCGRPNHLSVFPSLFVADHSSLNQDVIEEYIHDYVVAGNDISRYPLAAAHNVLRVEGLSRLAAPTSELCFL